ncbi:MAG: hypothetical protein KDB25_10635 [Leucobacter sp.]|nr:hypothetical protein [Leucobacter sp.]
MRKKSGRLAATKAIERLLDTEKFVAEVTNAGLSKDALSRAHNVAIIESAITLERLVLDCLVVAINNDVSVIRTESQVNFPAHLQDDVVEYIIVGNGYFDFRGGKSGIVKAVKQYLVDSHWVTQAVKRLDASQIDRLIALRNWAAHESPQSARKAKAAVNQVRARSAGSWAKVDGRIFEITAAVRAFALDIQHSAPY